MTILPRMDPGSVTLPPLIGRTHELAVARAHLTRPGLRVITIRGPGGVGKTRLAQTLLADLFSAFDLGGCFVDLAPHRGEGQLLPAIVQALHLPASPEPALDRLATAIGHHTILLVLDNLEHLPEPEADLAALTTRLPGARCLVTSRHVLHLRGVQELPLGPLAVPGTPAEAAGSPAVQLFVQRAREVDPDFTLTSENAPVLSAICGLLEGLPLALELAAARLRAVDLDGLLGWLKAPLEVLTGGPVDDAPRRQSLRSAVRWSADLLTPVEREVFLACGVFLGGFTLDALEAVSGLEDTRSVLIALVDHSLVQRGSGSEPRWRLLEPVRDFAVAEGRDTGRADRLAHRHAHYYLGLAERLTSHGERMTADTVVRLQADDANLHAALEHCICTAATEEAQRFVQTLTGFWAGQGGLARALSLCGRVLALPGDPRTATRAEVLQSSAWLAIRHQSALAVTWASEALEVWQALGDLPGEASALSTLADAYASQGRPGEAIECFQLALRLAESQHDLPLEAQTRHNLGVPLASVGQYAAALEHVERALEIYTTMEHPLGQAAASALCARLSALHGDLDTSLSHLQRSRFLGRELNDRFFEESLLHIAALLSQRRGRLIQSVRLAAASIAVQTRTDVRLPESCEAERRELVAGLRAALPEAAFTAAWEFGTHAGPDTVAAELDGALHAEEPSASTTHALTPRELEVLSWVTQGHSDKKVAQTLGISPGTVGKHVASLLGKLQLHNRVELTRWAVDHHLTP